MGTVKNWAVPFEDMEIILPANDNETTHHRNSADRCSSLGRVRILALGIRQRPEDDITKIFTVLSILRVSASILLRHCY